MTAKAQATNTAKPDMAFIDKDGHRFVWWWGMNCLLNEDAVPCYPHMDLDGLVDFVESSGMKKIPFPSGVRVGSDGEDHFKKTSIVAVPA